MCLHSMIGIHFGFWLIVEGEFLKPKCIRDDGYGTECHGRACDHRAEQNAEEGVEDARSDWYARGVVDEGEEEILPDVCA